MANKYHRQGYLSAGLVKKLVTAKSDNKELLKKLIRETKKLVSPKFFKDKKVRVKTLPGEKPIEFNKEILTVDESIDIDQMSNNQIKKQIQKFAPIVGSKNKKLAKEVNQSGLTKKIRTSNGD
jgi:hypothetical protein